MLRLFRSVVKSAAKGAIRDPEVQRLIKKHPRTADFIKKRLTPDQEFGLHLTIGVLVTLVFLYFFFNILQDLIGFESLIQADLRLINLLQILRDSTWNHVMLFITYMGNGQVVFLGLLFVAALLVLRSRWHYFIALSFSVLVGEIFLWLVKNIIERPRPPLTHALLPVAGYSFPSGHSFVALSFYGLLFYFFWRAAKGMGRRTLIIIAGLFVVLLIGFSRIYLGVHWPSDVLASYASGSAFLTIIITALEINRKFFRKGEGPPRISVSTLRILAVMCAVMWIFFLGYYYDKHPLPASAEEGPPETISISSSRIPNNLFSILPSYTEGITGKRIEPVNIVVVASEEELRTTFEAAGWSVSDQISFHSLARLAKAVTLKTPYPASPGTPTFWQARANDLSFAKPTEANTITERHHIHFWDSGCVVEDGSHVWLGTAHFDTSITLTSSIIIPAHQIDPAVDKERDRIKDELLGTNLVNTWQVYQIVEPTLGKNIVGDEFFTDGKAYIFFLKDKKAVQ